MNKKIAMSSVAWARWRKPICMNDCLDGYWGGPLFHLEQHLHYCVPLTFSQITSKSPKKFKDPWKIIIIWGKLLWDNMKPRILSQCILSVWTPCTFTQHLRVDSTRSIRECSLYAAEWEDEVLPPWLWTSHHDPHKNENWKIALRWEYQKEEEKTSYFTKKSCGISRKKKIRQRRQ